MADDDIPVYEAPPVDPVPDPSTQSRRGVEPGYGGDAE
jgi:hypothetical protein